MSTYTPNLNLLKKNPLTEGSDVFNIETMMNDNWDKIDSFSALLEASIAPLYSTSSAYAVGAWCTHDGKLYQCTTAIGSGGEAWNASHWTAKSTTELITAVKAAIPSAYASTPAMNGTGSAGSSTQWARGNHVHPVDTSRASQAEVDSLVRPNVLDNGCFAAPINTRGSSSYTGAVYGIDRWRGMQSYSVMTLQTTDIKFSVSQACAAATRIFHQIVRNPTVYAGRTMTLSALVTACSGSNWAIGCRFANNGSVLGFADLPFTGTPGLYTKTFTVPSTLTEFVCRLAAKDSGTLSAGNYVSLAGIKLEFGETQTLARNTGTAANPVWVLNGLTEYNEELLRCSNGSNVDSNDNGTKLALYRREAFFSSDTTPGLNDAICWTYS